MSLTKLIDMRKTSEEKMEDAMCMPLGAVNEYPYGLCISLGNDELDKLGADHAELQVGDVVDLRSLARVTSISENETEAGKNCRVELQIVMMGVELENDEIEEEPEPRSRLKHKRG